jgi:hypothetical protein
MLLQSPYDKVLTLLFIRCSVMRNILLVSFTFLFGYSIRLTAQNLESIGKEKPLSVSGALSLNQIFYTANGIQSRRDPYSYYASGNMNVSLYGWSVPVSFAVSNQNTSFQQPFNQYSVHPAYKWITGHFGYTSMSYSPYTVNGHIFLGGAVDATPEGKWKFSALYGRFLKAVEPDTTRAGAQLPAFKRMGYGFKATYGDAGGFVDLIMFRAKDEINSIRYVPDSLGIVPQENLVISIGAGKTLFRHFLLKAELATSALSNDIRAEQTDLSHPLAHADFLYTPRLSSSFYNAFKTSLDYQQDFFTLGVAYERIDPQYRTLGAYFFNNDLENITVNGSASVLQGRMNVAVSAGSQHDNLDKSKISTMRRAVGSIHVNYAASQQLNLSASYSNFQTYTNIRSQFQLINQLTPYDNLDTLNFTQLSQNITATALYSFGRNNNRKQNINLNLNIQDASDRQGNVPQNSGMRFYNFNTAYSINFVPQNMVASVSFNATINEGATINTRTYGPVASVSRAFLEKKLRTTLSSSYNTTYSDGMKINSIVNGRFTGAFSVRKKHTINLSAVVVNRETAREGGSKSFTEFTGMVGYHYNFSTASHDR